MDQTSTRVVRARHVEMQLLAVVVGVGSLTLVRYLVVDDFSFTRIEKVLGPVGLAGALWLVARMIRRWRDPYWRFDELGISEGGRPHLIAWDDIDRWTIQNYLGNDSIILYESSGRWRNLALVNFAEPLQAIAAIQERLGPPAAAAGQRPRDRMPRRSGR